MIQFLNNIWIILISENINLINFLLIPATIIENYLLMNLFLIILKVPSCKKQKLLYIFILTLLNLFNLNVLPAPLNVIINYLCVFFCIKFIFKLSLFKSLIGLIVPIFIFGLINVFLQNPFLTILEITPEAFINIPLYRLTYLAILYVFTGLLCIILKKFININFTLELLDNLDKKTIRLLGINVGIGLLTLCIQLITTTFYIDIVPISITILNFILLISFLALSIYSFTRIVKLASARENLQSAEDYNKSLEILYDKVKGFKHDFDNIISTLDGFIENSDMCGLKDYFEEIKKDCKITNHLSILNPRIINNPGIYSLLNNKYFKATNLGINFEIEYFLNLKKLNINLYEFSRILGVLIDNAIEEAEKCNEKLVKISFLKENRNNRAVITIQNTYSNKDVDINKIFNKGESGKENHSGIGLWEVMNYIKKSKNLDLFTSKDNNFFKQELSIYNIKAE